MPITVTHNVDPKLNCAWRGYAAQCAVQTQPRLVKGHLKTNLTFARCSRGEGFLTFWLQLGSFMPPTSLTRPSQGTCDTRQGTHGPCHA
jgi:hypothetical protein